MDICGKSSHEKLVVKAWEAISDHLASDSPVLTVIVLCHCACIIYKVPLFTLSWQGLYNLLYSLKRERPFIDSTYKWPADEMGQLMKCSSCTQKMFSFAQQQHKFH